MPCGTLRSLQQDDSTSLNSLKNLFGKSRYEGGKKYCRRCEVYYYHEGIFCACCGMALRASPTSKRDKERLRQLQLRREEQDRIIRSQILVIISGVFRIRGFTLIVAFTVDLKFGNASKT